MCDICKDFVVRCVAAAARQRLRAKRVLLFGSRARHTHRRTSDYDFAIDPGEPPFNDREWSLFLEYLDEEAPTLNKLDVIDLARPLRQSLRDEIEGTGVRVEAYL